MKMRVRVCALLGVLFFLGGAGVQAQSLVIYTEHYPPYNYLDEQGEVSGVATEKVRQVMDATGLDYSIQLVPWARAVYNTKAQDNALIYTITRTPKREQNFDWLVPLAESNFYLFVRSRDDRAVTPAALKAGVFKGTCVSNDLTCELLRWTGMPAKNIIPISKEGTGDFRMVIARRADIYISDLSVNRRLRETEGFDPSLTKPALRLWVETGFYLAGGLKVPDAIRQQIRTAYKQLAAVGDYELVDTDALQE